MKRIDVSIVQTGVANTASIVAALERTGARPRFAESADDIASCERVLVPGVGTFASGIAAIREQRLEEALVRRIRADQATLLVCVGLQLLCERSEESPDAKGLGIIDDTVRRFSGELRVPQLGWNRVEVRNTRFLDSGFAYFANSYALKTRPPGWKSAIASYGGEFVAALERGKIVACQFHPELSGAYGLEIMRRWVWQDEVQE